MNRIVILVPVVALAVLMATVAPAQAVPTTVSFTASLADDAGPVTESVALTARIYDANQVLIWEESHPSVQPDDGLVYLELGSVDATNNALDATVFGGTARFLELVVNGDVLSPRIAISSVPYAVRADRADLAERATASDTLGGLRATDFARADHNHDGQYLPLGANRTCALGFVVTKILPTGDVDCIPAGSSYTAKAGGGLVLEAGNQFSILSNGIDSAMIKDNSITSNDILDGTISSIDIKAGAITATHLAPNSVTSATIADNSITTNDILDGTITGADIKPGAITSTHLASASVGSSHVGTGAITTGAIANDSITASKIYDRRKLYLVTSKGCHAAEGTLMMTPTCVGKPYINCAGGSFSQVDHWCSNVSVGWLVPL